MFDGMRFFSATYKVCAYLLLSHVLMGQHEIQQLHRRGQYQELVRRAESSEIKESDDLLLVAHAYYLINLEEKALIYLDKAEKSGNKNPTIHLLKAQSLRYIGKLNEAAESAAAFLSLQPENVEGHFEMGMVYYLMNEPEKSLPFFERSASSNNPPSGSKYMYGHVCLVLNQFERAKDILENACLSSSSSDPYMRRSWEDYGIVLNHAKEKTKALNAFLTSIYYKGSSNLIYFRALDLLYKSGDKDRADSVFNLVIKRAKEKDLDREYLENNYYPILEFELNDSSEVKIKIYQHLKQPTRPTDLYYTIFVNHPKKNKKFVVENIDRVSLNMPQFILKEKISGQGNLVYDPKWRSPIVGVDELIHVIKNVLTGQLLPGMQSYSSESTLPEKKNRR
jgi:Tfp pilus assembly protein PilF